MATSLPPPATVEEMYLAAILAELQGIRSDIRSWPNNSVEQMVTDAIGGEIDLKEPKQTAKTKTKK